LGRLDRFANDQLVGKGVDEGADADQIGAPTAAFARAPPEILPTVTEPATTAATFVVELEIKTKSASTPYF
jgi:hypothetical protein